MQKQLTAIVFISMLILPTLGMVGWLKLRKYQIRYEVKEKVLQGMDKSELVKLTFSEAERINVEWEDDHEFEYLGQMYDVVITEVLHDKVVYWCWHDSDETELKKQLTSLTEKIFTNDSSQKQQTVQFIQFFQSLFVPVSYQWVATRPFTWQNDATGYFRSYATVQLGLDTPPPRS